jgi:hypothetical protein
MIAMESGMSDTEATRLAALAQLEPAGIKWTLVKTGQRHLIDFNIGGSPGRALVKTGSLGQAIVKSSEDDPDRARLSGFSDDLSHVLFAIGTRSGTGVDAYLVPRDEAESAWRENHRAWKATHTASPPNTTWVIRFGGSSKSPYSGFAEKWDRYRVRPSEPPSRESVKVQNDPGLSPEQAKRGLAIFFGVKPDNIKIIIVT